VAQIRRELIPGVASTAGAMPRGGHFGLWKPTPKDIFKSRWKKWYKRCYRWRTPGNEPDRAPPHIGALLRDGPPDGVPSPWKLHYSVDNFSAVRPSDLRRYAYRAYESNVGDFLLPYRNCRQPALRDAVLRSLDWGRRGVSDSGLGRAEVVRFGASEPTSQGGREAAAVPELLPKHIHAAILSKAAKEKELGSFMEVLTQESHSDWFPVRRLYELCEEKEIAFGGMLERKPRGGGADGGGAGRGGTGDGLSEKPTDRGRFPYVDEKASLIDEVNLNQILRLRHKTNSRHHPKWREVRYTFKKWQQQYLRRRHMLKEEEKERMTAIKMAAAE